MPAMPAPSAISAASIDSTTVSQFTWLNKENGRGSSHHEKLLAFIELCLFVFADSLLLGYTDCQ
eukprot:5107286-Amphidinium_carterae.2